MSAQEGEILGKSFSAVSAIVVRDLYHFPKSGARRPFLPVLGLRRQVTTLVLLRDVSSLSRLLQVQPMKSSRPPRFAETTSSPSGRSSRGSRWRTPRPLFRQVRQGRMATGYASSAAELTKGGISRSTTSGLRKNHRAGNLRPACNSHNAGHHDFSRRVWVCPRPSLSPRYLADTTKRIGIKPGPLPGVRQMAGERQRPRRGRSSWTGRSTSPPGSSGRGWATATPRR